MASSTNYSRRIARLSARIFGEVVRQTTPSQYKVVQRFAKKPMGDDLINYYPPIDKFSQLLRRLRILGLYRDEHLDFAEKMRDQRKARGKGPPAKGEGKRAKKGK